MKLLLFIFASFLCFLPYASATNDRDEALTKKIEILLVARTKYIDKKNDAEKIYYSIKFEVYFINKTKRDLVIPAKDNNLNFSVNYTSIQNFDKTPSSLSPVLFFYTGGKVLLKANSYTKMEFKYPLAEYEFNRNIKPDKHNILQCWCGYLSNRIKSNIVNIPIISPTRKSMRKKETSNENSVLRKQEDTEKEKKHHSFPEKRNNCDVVLLKASGEVFINGKKVEIKDIHLQREDAIVFFDKNAHQEDVLALLKQIAKSSVCPVLKFGEMPNSETGSSAPPTSGALSSRQKSISK